MFLFSKCLGELLAFALDVVTVATVVFAVTVRSSTASCSIGECRNWWKERRQKTVESKAASKGLEEVQGSVRKWVENIVLY